MNFIALLCFLGALAFRCSCGNDARSDEPVDSIRASAALPHLVLLEATFDAPELECLTADRTAFDETARTVTYTWHVKAQDGQPQENITVDYIISKDEPDRVLAVLNFNISNPIQGQAVYSDYSTCVIEKLFGSQPICFHWVATGTENNVPGACSAAMNETCGGGVLLYTDEACK